MLYSALNDFLDSVGGAGNFLRLVRSNEELNKMLPEDGSVGLLRDKEGAITPAIDVGDTILALEGATGMYESDMNAYPRTRYVDLLIDNRMKIVCSDDNIYVKHDNRSTLRVKQGDEEVSVMFTEIPNDAKLRMEYSGRFRLNIGSVDWAIA
jgi:hypothetical protein